MNNADYLKRLIWLVSEIADSVILDQYLTRILKQEIKGSWKTLVQIVSSAKAGSYWEWKDEDRCAYFDHAKELPDFSIFCTLMLHECAHGICYFLLKSPVTYKYPEGFDEEKSCHEISQLVCEVIGITFESSIARLAYEIHIADKSGDIEMRRRLLLRVPEYLSVPQPN